MSELCCNFALQEMTDASKNAISPYFDGSGNKNIGAIIRIVREIWCLPYAGFSKKDFSTWKPLDPLYSKQQLALICPLPLFFRWEITDCCWILLVEVKQYNVRGGSLTF